MLFRGLNKVKREVDFVLMLLNIRKLVVSCAIKHIITGKVFETEDKKIKGTVTEQKERK